MANGTGDPRGFNKGRSSKFRVGYRIRQTPEEGWKTYRPKRCGNEDEDNSPNPRWFSLKALLQPNASIRCAMCSAGQFRVSFGEL